MDSGARVEATKRLTWLAGFILFWGALLFTKLFLLQVVHHQDYLRLARQQQEKLVEIPAPRGAVYDRTGEILAMSTPMDSVFVDPRHVPDLRVAADILSRILKLDESQLYGRLQWAVANHRGFLWIKRKISPEESQRLKSLHLDWISFDTESQRHYPKGTLAANVLGSVNYKEIGNAGLELSMNRALTGHAGEERMLTDVKRRGIDSYATTKARAGTSLTLTIDERIQYVAERELAQAVESAHGRSGSVVVMNPYTGEILAMASYPTFDPNKPPKPGEDPMKRFNEAVSVPFEPGSVFKVVTLSAALETTNLHPDTIIDCGNGTITLFGRTIHEAHRGYGRIPMWEVLKKSSNIGAIKIGLQVGQQNLYKYVRRFGFGRETGIPLPAESAGLLRKLSRWGKTSIGSVAMGHEISVTTLQLARACSVVANGGLLVKPKLILRRGNTPTPTDPPIRVLQPETTILMRKMMGGVVMPGGTGTRARLDGYTCGGKTGSAQIFDFAARHYTHLYNASFMGLAPLANPAIVVVATVNGTHEFGGLASAPVFKAVAEEALRVLDVPKDLPETPPTLVAQGNAAEGDDLSISDLDSTGPDAAEQPLVPTAPVPVAFTPSAPNLTGPRAPNFLGKTMRAVVEEASSHGLSVILNGSGIARAQDPAPGGILRPGERIQVQFAR